MDSITITRPDDWHVHLRDGEMLQRVTPYSAAQFGRVMVMPNLAPPVTNVSMALKYRQRICDAAANQSGFEPKLSLYLTDQTSVSDVLEANAQEHIVGFKLYPAGATTNSASGVSRISDLMTVLEAISDTKLVLQIHGEVTDSHVDIFDREAVFIEQVLEPLVRELPELKLILEHITTKNGVQFVEQSGEKIGGTITPQHLLFNRNELFRGGIRPHAYCLPVLKRETHRQALLEAATGGNTSFFLGTDSAPHTRSSKQSNCGCAGIFSASAAIEIYAQIFDQMDRLDKLEGFASFHGADFYDLPRNTESITLVRQSNSVAELIPASDGGSDDDLIPLLAGERLLWKLASD